VTAIPPTFLPDELDLADVQTRRMSNPSSRTSRTIANAHRTPAAGLPNVREPIARRVDLPAAVALQLSADLMVVLGLQSAPSSVA
jgi:hypothetical protein